jgi:RimJ/RimL family protein N-acetyltransferase
MRIATPSDFDHIQNILDKAGESGETMLSKPDAKPENLLGFFLVDDHGCFWCKPIDNETLEVHTTFEPKYRGQYARDLARVGQRMVFTELDVRRVITKCKLHHKYVVAFAQWMGFKQIGIVDDTIILECPLEAYVMLDTDLCDFAIDAGFPLPAICPQEQANFAGFFVLCYRNGLLMKGLQAYNRMALLLDWEPLLLTSSNPILLTIGDRQFSPSSLTEA